MLNKEAINAIVSSRIIVTDYNRVSGDSFEVFWEQQAPDFVVLLTSALTSAHSRPNRPRYFRSRDRRHEQRGGTVIKTRDLVAIGIPAGPCADAAKEILQRAHAASRSMDGVRDELKRLTASPATFVNDEIYGRLARQLLDHSTAAGTFRPRRGDAPYRMWRSGFEESAVQQLKNALQAAGVGCRGAHA